MARITVDENEWSKLKRDMQLLKEKSKLLEVKQHLNATQTDLTEREKAVLNYVKTNPGTNKQAIVDELKQQHSRSPIFKTISDLVNYGMLIEREDKANRQTCNLFINSENVVVALVENLENYKRSVYEVISWVRRMEKLKVEKKSDSSAVEEKRANISAMALQYLKENAAATLEAMHFCLIISYFVTALFKWPLLAPDKETQNRLYAIFFSSIQEIQFEFVKFVPQFYGRGDIQNMGMQIARVIPLEGFIQFLSQFSTASRLGEFRLFAGMYNPLVTIMDLIWRNSSDFVNFEDKNGTKIKDWRDVERNMSPKQPKRSDNAHTRMNKFLDFLKKNPDVSIPENKEIFKILGLH